MASIAQRLFNYVPTNYLLLAGEEWVRPLPQLGAWNRIRIGVLCAVTPVPNNGALYDGGLFLSLCSGRWNTNSSYLPDNVVGACYGGSAALGSSRSWAYNVSTTGYPYYSPTSGTYFHRYLNPISGVQTATSGINVTPWLPLTGIGIRKRRVPIILDISRNPLTGLYSIQSYNPSDTTSDWRMDQLIEAVDSYGTPIIGGYTWNAATPGSLNLAESSGTFDTMSVWWTNVTYGLEVYGVCASMLADAGTSTQLAYPQVGGGYDVVGTAGTLVGTPITGTGTAWTGLNTGRGFFAPYSFQGTGSPGPVIGMSGTDIGADETFDQYASGTAMSGFLNGGTNWAAAWTVAGTYSNINPVTVTNGLYGTSNGAYDSFETYPIGTATSLSAGSNWAGPYTAVAYPGTTYANPTSATSGTFMNGTASGWPWDNFESYSTGAITLLTGGTGWGSFGTIYDF